MKKIISFILAILGYASLGAQPIIGFHLLGSQPLNQFKTQNYREGIGFDFEFFSGNLIAKNDETAKIGFRVGGLIEFQAAGRERFKVTLNTPNNDRGTLRVANNHFGLLLAGRLSAFDNERVTPYLDGFIGPRIFSTEEIIDADRRIRGYENETRRNIIDRGALHRGLAVGLLFNINSDVSIDARFSYSKGDAARWTDLDNTRKSGNEMVYAFKNSATDLYLFRLGVVFKIRDWQNSSSRSSNEVRPDSRFYIPWQSRPAKPLELKPNPKPLH